METITDTLYGKTEIENVISEIIATPIFQRMKGIHLAGGASLVNTQWTVTRYDHSIGTFILSKVLGGSIEQQIKSLLHDISHTAFSHVIDYITDNKQENYHDNIQEQMIKDSLLPSILDTYGICINDIINQPYLVLDAELPALSIDRIDYTLRDLVMQEKVSIPEVTAFIDELCVANNIVHVKSINAAEWFVQKYQQEVADYFQHPLNIYANTEITNILKTALKNKYITLNDFSKFTDRQLLEKILGANDKDMNCKIDDLLHTTMNNISSKTKHSKKITPKKRVIRPNIVTNKTT